MNVFDNSPAKEGGLLPGDIIYKIDGEEVTGTDLDVLVKTKIRGVEGSSFTMTVIRGDEKKTGGLKPYQKVYRGTDSIFKDA